MWFTTFFTLFISFAISPTMASTPPVENDCRQYSVLIRKKIIQRWKQPPQSRPFATRKPTLHLRINKENGQVSWTWIQRSGNIASDNAAMLAIPSYLPLPANCSEVIENGIAISFNR